MEAVAETIEPCRARQLGLGGKRRQRSVRIIRRKELAETREPARLLEVQVGDEQRLAGGPIERPVGTGRERFACERKGNHLSVIARSAATKQSRICNERLDCFATLGMTR